MSRDAILPLAPGHGPACDPEDPCESCAVAYSAPYERDEGETRDTQPEAERVTWAPEEQP